MLTDQLATEEEDRQANDSFKYRIEPLTENLKLKDKPSLMYPMILLIQRFVLVGLIFASHGLAKVGFFHINHFFVTTFALGI